MDRNRDARRTTMAAANGLPRRRQRSSGLRYSPEEDGAMELQETVRLRDRKKDRDRERERERERDRERDRLNRSKRRRGGGGVGGGGERDESSEESVNDEDEDDDEDAGGGASMPMLPPQNPASASGAMSMAMSASSSMMTHHNHHHHHHQHHHNNNNNNNNHSHNSNNNNSNNHNHHQPQHQRKSFPPPPAKNFRPAPAAALKATDEMIGVSVPRKARSVSTKRSHEWSSSSIGIGGDQIHRQASTSPVRPGLSAAVSAATMAGTVSASPAPVSPPSSSNASVRKKLKPNSGPKLRQPKPPSSKSSSSAQEEIEKEIAEVLYGMKRQPQETVANDSSNNNNNKSASDANKSSSPISSSQYGPSQPPSRPAGGDSAVPAWAFCVAPKRKKPRHVKYDGKFEDGKPSYLPVQNNPISSSTKIPTDQLAKTESSSANLEKNLGSAPENGGVASETAQSHTVPPSTESQPESVKLESSLVSDSKPVADISEGRDLSANKEEPQSPKNESVGLRLDDKRETETATATKLNSTTSEIESQREEKFQIDLMAPPPSRSSPERDGEIDFVAADAKPMAKDTEAEIKPVVKEDTKALKLGREQVEPVNVEPERAKATITCTVEESESKKLPAVVVKDRNVDHHLDLEKTDATRDGGSFGGGNANKLHHHSLSRHHQQPPPQTQLHNNEKAAQSGALPLPTMSMATWPGGLPPMGYMTPLQGVVSMDGSAVSSAAIQPPPYIFNQPRPKRCATHFYIARSISLHQQIARMNPFWPAAGSGPVYGAKPCNLNIMPAADLHGNVPAGHRGMNPIQDKGQGLAMFPAHNGKDKASGPAAGAVDPAQRKQILLQQALPPGAPTNLLQGPAIIFPLSQQQAVAAAAASVRPPGSVKSPPAAVNTTATNGSNSTAAAASASAVAAAAAAGAQAMTFNYPNMPGNEAPQYLAINAYPFPIPAHVGAPQAYRGAHPQAMPFFNGSFYSTFHPSQLPQQQPPTHSQQTQQQQAHQNPSMSSGSSSSQKHLQNQQQQQRQSQHSNAMNGSGGSLQGFPTSKNPSSQQHQQIQMQQRQHQSQHMAHQARQLESEMGSEESPYTADSRVSRPSMSIYGQNFAMPIHAPPNFALMTPASISGAAGPAGGNGEKKQQQQGSKGGGVEPQAFAVSFTTMNGGPAAPPGLDIASLTQQQAMFPDARQGYHQQYMAAAAAHAVAQQKKSYRGPEDGKTGGDTSNAEEERKAMKGSGGVSQSIAFSRPNLSDASGTALPGTTVVDSSARTLNLGSAQPRSSGSVMPVGMTNVNTSSAQQRNQQQQQQQQQQMIQLQKQHQQHQQLQQQLVAASRNKAPPATNGSVYSDQLPSSMAAKFPNALSPYPQSLVTTSPAQSPQWKNSGRPTQSQVPSPSMTSSSSSSLKNLSQQQQGRPQQTHTQISFAAAANQKPSMGQSQVGLQPASTNQSLSPPIMVGSPTTSSVSKSAGGSPRTTTNSTSAGNKVGQASSLSSQQAKNSPSVSNMKSSPVVSGKNVNVSSILGNPHITSSSSTAAAAADGGAKSQFSQQQPHLSKQSLQQAQLFFSSYLPNQAQHTNSPAQTIAAAAASGPYYTQRRRPEQQQQQGPAGTSSSGMLSLCPAVTLSNTSTSDPSKANKGLASQTIIHPAQFAAAVQSRNPHQMLPAGFPYVHAVPAGVQVKPAEQKQPAGE